MVGCAALHVVIVAVIGAVPVLAWLIVFEVVSTLLWENELVLANPWLFPAICLPFLMLVGLLLQLGRREGRVRFDFVCAGRRPRR